MSRTTRKPVVNVEVQLPFLKGAARITTRLHPQREAGLPPTISKIGGAIVWPADQPRPVDVRKRCPAVPVLQLRKSDVGTLKFPPGTDLFQMLWYTQSCDARPGIEIYWRRLSRLKVADILEPVYDNDETLFRIQECRLIPEEVIEYPDVGLLPETEQKQIWDWEDDLRQAGLYQYSLSTCPGTKVGGYPQFAGQDAVIPVGGTGRPMEYLLTISDNEWDGGSGERWRPIEIEPPPGHTVRVELPGRAGQEGDSIEYLAYSPEEKKRAKKWNLMLHQAYHDACSPSGTYLKYPLNVFLDKSHKPWGCGVA